MKKSFMAFAVLFLFAVQMNAQLDVSVNPIGILFNSYDVSVENGFSENFGVELTVGLSTSKYSIDDEDISSTGFGTRLMAKYYLSPSKGLDRFNIGAYLRYGSNKFEDGTDEVSNTRIAGGFYLGYKIVSSKKIFFEIGFGVGKAFTNSYSVDGEEVVDGADYPILNIDATGKFAVGYRF
ncbi:MAG: DUF3575 domain-containing protein [Saprospiraceae bacterium]|nr:DUF3575 domain-containing protein [Saprospiraceae bacterium]